MEFSKLFLTLDYIGVFMFSISGLLAAREKNLDLFGGLAVAFVTALGGGTLRDMLLGTEVAWMKNVNYVYIVFIGSVAAIVFKKVAKKMRKTLFFFDTIGLGLFTIIGVQKAIKFEEPLFVVAMLGIITATFGGVIRDIIVNEIPLLFRKEIYALASVAGAALYLVLNHFGVLEVISVFTSMALIIGIRSLAVLKSLSLPILKNH